PPKWTCDHDPVAGYSAGAAYGPLLTRFAKQRYRHDQRAIPTVGVAADDGRIEGIGDFAHPLIKALGQFESTMTRQPKTDKGRRRHARHGGEIAEIDCHGFPSHGARSRLLEQEATTLQKHVGRDE